MYKGHFARKYVQYFRLNTDREANCTPTDKLTNSELVYRHFAGGVSGWQSHDQSVYKHRGHVTSVSLCRSADDVLCRLNPDVLMGKPYLRSN